MNLWLSAGLTIITCGSLIAIEVLKRRFKISAEYTRRIAHIIIGTMGILGYLLGPIWLYAVVVGVLLIALMVFRRGNTLSSVTGVKRKSYGDILLPIGLLAAIPLTIHNPIYYIASISVMVYADSLCGIMSDISKKPAHTLAGSLVFMLATFIIFTIFTEIEWTHILWISLLLTVVEYYSKKGSDNLTLPVAAGLILLLF